MVNQKPQDSGPRDVDVIGAGPGSAPPPPSEPARGWTAGRIIALVAGSLLALIALGVFGSGVTLLWADQTQRTNGYLSVDTGTYSTSGYALVSERITLHGGWEFAEPFIGQTRVQVTSADPARAVFIAVGSAGQVSRYLTGTRYATITSSGAVTRHQGNRIPAPPVAARIWAAHAAGTGTQTLRWTPENGTWVVAAMNSDGSAGLTIHAKVSIAAPLLFRVAVELMIGGALLGVLAAALIVVPVRLAAVREDLRGA